MINARLAAQNEANQRTTTEQGQKMNALTTDVAAQQQKKGLNTINKCKVWRRSLSGHMSKLKV